MSPIFIERERIEWRVLGALRFIDGVTSAPVDGPMIVSARGVRFVRNRSGLYVIHEAPGFAEYQASFAAPPASPAVGSVPIDVTVVDPGGRYLSRAARLMFPRDPAPAAAASLFEPADIPMYPAPAARVAVNWSVLRVSVTAGNGDHLGGVLLRVLKGNKVMARGLTDWRGEALVPVAGVPVTTFGESAGAVVTSEIHVVLHGVFDAASGSRTPHAAVSAGRMPPLPSPVDPDALEAAARTLPHSQKNLTIAARRTQSASLVIG